MGLDKHESKLTNLEIFLETEEKQVWNWFSDIRPRLFYWKNIFDQTVSVRWITLSPPTSCIQFPHIKLVLSKFMIWMLLDFTSLSHPWHIVLEVKFQLWYLTCQMFLMLIVFSKLYIARNWKSGLSRSKMFDSHFCLTDEELIKWGWPEDVWFHVDKVSSAHVYLRLKEGETLDDVPMAVIIGKIQLELIVKRIWKLIFLSKMLHN